MLENNMLEFYESQTSDELDTDDYALASISFTPYSQPRSSVYGNDLRFNFANGEFVEGVATDVDFNLYLGIGVL